MWQTLETKARFIQQVMTGETSVRTAEDLEGGALTYAEIKAIASGHPAVMEKVKVDTEVRKLDQLRAAHLKQQHGIRLQIQALPTEIRRREERIAKLATDIALRDAHAGLEFAMTVGGRLYSGKDAREAAAAALNAAILSRAADPEPRLCGSFRGFEILSRGRAEGAVLFTDADNLPEIQVRGQATLSAQLNPENAVGTIQSIEHALRALDKNSADEAGRLARCRKMLCDYQEQLGRRFEHEERLRELLARQAEINAMLDVDKGEQQAAAPETSDATVVAERAPGMDSTTSQRARAAWTPQSWRAYDPPADDDLDNEEPESVPQRGPPMTGQFP